MTAAPKPEGDGSSAPFPGMSNWSPIAQDVDLELGSCGWVFSESWSVDEETGLRLQFVAEASLERLGDLRYSYERFVVWRLFEDDRPVDLRGRRRGSIAGREVTDHGEAAPTASPTHAEAVESALADGRARSPFLPGREGQSKVLWETIAFRRNLRRLRIDPANAAAIEYLEALGPLELLSPDDPSVLLALRIHRNP